MDIAGAQWRLGRLGRLSRIDLRLATGADPATTRAAVAALLPADAIVTSAADDRARTGDLSRAYRVNLDMLALMALFTGAFLVYSTQSLAVARRRAQLALLRVIGVTRRRVVGQVLAEGAAQGIVGGVLGLAGGVGFAALVLRCVRRRPRRRLLRAPWRERARAVRRRARRGRAVLRARHRRGARRQLLPGARSAARAAPALALKSSGAEAGRGVATPWIAATLVASGIACALLPAIAGLPIAGYVAMALLLFGGIAAMPWIARRLPRAVRARRAAARRRARPRAAPAVGRAVGGVGRAERHRRVGEPDGRDDGDDRELPALGRRVARRGAVGRPVRAHRDAGEGLGPRRCRATATRSRRRARRPAEGRAARAVGDEAAGGVDRAHAR